LVLAPAAPLLVGWAGAAGAVVGAGLAAAGAAVGGGALGGAAGPQAASSAAAPLRVVIRTNWRRLSRPMQAISLSDGAALRAQDLK
jgi:hypothetical protein